MRLRSLDVITSNHEPEGVSRPTKAHHQGKGSILGFCSRARLSVQLAISTTSVGEKAAGSAVAE
jgi:hypothetical protein